MNHASPETGDLPVVEVHVNGGRPAHSLIDTGGGEVVLNSAFAQESKAIWFTSTQGTFAGGKQAPVLEGRIDSLTLGTFTIKNVPVQIIDLSGIHIDGVIGTVLLYHFLATINYPGKRLVLRRLSQSKQLETAKGMVVPFRMAGDHYMVAQGTVNGRGPLLFLVDTGLNGGGFATSPMQAALITKDLKPSETGVGGGAALAIPFTVDRLSLGDATQTNVQGLAMDGLPENGIRLSPGWLDLSRLFQALRRDVRFREDANRAFRTETGRNYHDGIRGQPIARSGPVYEQLLYCEQGTRAAVWNNSRLLEALEHLS